MFTLLTVKDQHHTVQVAWVQEFESVTKWMIPPAYVAAGTSTHVQVESGVYLHQVIEGKYHKFQVQRSGYMVQ